jgi:hypothetical protein
VRVAMIGNLVNMLTRSERGEETLRRLSGGSMHLATETVLRNRTHGGIGAVELAALAHREIFGAALLVGDERHHVQAEPFSARVSSASFARTTAATIGGRSG